MKKMSESRGANYHAMHLVNQSECCTLSATESTECYQFVTEIRQWACCLFVYSPTYLPSNQLTNHKHQEAKPQHLYSIHKCLHTTYHIQTFKYALYYEGLLLANICRSYIRSWHLCNTACV